jgi:preprotein translocase subunit SecF
MAGLVRKLYRGETRFHFIRNRKRWYLASALLVLISLGSIIFRGFNYSIEFSGGTQFQYTVTGTNITPTEVAKAFSDSGTTPADAPQEVGSGGTRQIVVKTDSLDPAKQKTLEDKVAAIIGKQPDQVQSVSSSWGHDISVKAVQGLIVFLIAVTIYISLRYRWQMAVSALIGLAHDMVIAAGLYSIVGFAVSPSTIVGLLTILGFSLYDTVVVFDKVAENSKDILATGQMTFAEAANLAVNQTLMRSINTSLIGLLPVAGLLFVGVGVLGVGAIEDLALILFVGLATGAYSSLFLCTPVVVDFTERDPRYKALGKRVIAKRASMARRGESVEVISPTASVQPRATGASAPAPRPGARPQRKRK